MFGAYRFYLSLLVVLSHLWSVTLFKTGAQAVACFFVLSGFLMAKSIDVTYGRSFRGIQAYLINRFLRIYPVYWLILIPSFLFLLCFPDAAFNSQMRLSLDAATLFSNITLIGLYAYDNIIVPPAWSLTVEFFFYVAIGIVPFSTTLINKIFPIALIILPVTCAVGLQRNPHLFYFSLGLLTFSVGVLLHYYPIRAGKLIVPLFVACLLVLPLLHPIFSKLTIPTDPSIYCAGTFFAVVSIIFLSQYTPSAQHAQPSYFEKVLRKLDALLGDFALPLFLSHYFVAEILHFVLHLWNIFPKIEKYSFLSLIISLCFSLLASWAIIKYFEPQVQAIRNKVRGERSYIERMSNASHTACKEKRDL